MSVNSTKGRNRHSFGIWFLFNVFIYVYINNILGSILESALVLYMFSPIGHEIRYFEDLSSLRRSNGHRMRYFLEKQPNQAS